jgi:O-antigen ligase
MAVEEDGGVVHVSGERAATARHRTLGDDERVTRVDEEHAAGFATRQLLVWLSAFVLALALTFGGGTRQGLGSDGVPELFSLLLLAVALPRAWPFLRGSRAALALTIGVIILPIVQLIPLPPWLWSVLPGRQLVVDILTAANIPLGWRPMTLIPGVTARALLSLLPAVAIFLATLSLDREERRLLLLVAVAIGIVSVFLAMLQVIGGQDSWLYFYKVTNASRGVGFFANANHFGAFMYILLPFAAAALGGMRTRSAAFGLAVFGGLVPALLFGLALSGSRSAIIMGVLSIVTTVPLLLGPELTRLGGRRTLALGAGFLLALLPLLAGLGLTAILGRFGTQDVLTDARWGIAASTWAAVRNYFPFGSGVGTFPSVYPLSERTADLIPQFVNRAHNDLLETLLEGGFGSFILLLGFLVWLSFVARRAIVQDLAVVGRQARAGVLVMVLLLLHSLWDYPLRTIALEVLFALAAGLQFAPPPTSEDHRLWGARRARHRTLKA